MSLVRLSSMLFLAVALLLPPGLFRDCCCTQRALVPQPTVQTTATDKTVSDKATPVRSCCQAKAQAKSRQVALAARESKETSGPRLHSQCQCRTQVASLAILIVDQRVSSGSDSIPLWTLPGIDVERASISRNSLGMNAAPSSHYLDPPLRKTLCRWVI
jgi:hypothetical protein